MMMWSVIVKWEMLLLEWKLPLLAEIVSNYRYSRLVLYCSQNIWYILLFFWWKYGSSSNSGCNISWIIWNSLFSVSWNRTTAKKTSTKHFLSFILLLVWIGRLDHMNRCFQENNILPFG